MKENDKPNDDNDIFSQKSNVSEKFDFFLKEKPINKDNKEEKNNLEKKDENKEENKKERKKDEENEGEEKEDEEEEEEINIDLDKIKLGKKIICPEENCFANAIISIEPITFQVQSDCGKHARKMNILKFAEKSGIAKIENEICLECKTSIKELVEKEKILYKCYCGANICESCKKEHLKEKKLEKHNMVDFEQKDYICTCCKSLKKYLFFCFDCKKNLCIYCKKHHKEHQTKEFSELYKLGKEEKKELKKKIKEQKENINKIKIILDNWYKKIERIINNYKKKLDLYWELNNIILNIYNIKSNYYEEIKNIENIRYDFDQYFQELLKTENDTKKQNDIIFKIINEKDISINKEQKDQIIEIENIDKQEFGGEVRKICELTKENLLVVNIRVKKNNENITTEELHIYKKSDKNIFNEKHLVKPIEGGNIKSLSELKSGKLLIVQNNCFKIVDITLTKTEMNIIQDQDGIETFIKIIELINGYLASISYIPNKQRNIILWKKNLFSNLYEKEVIVHPDKIPQSILEINKFSFLVYFKDGFVSLYNSKTNKEREKMSKINNNNDVKNMIKINDNNVLMIYDQKLVIYNLLLNESSKIYTSKFNLLHLCKIPNTNNILTNYFDQKSFGLGKLYLDFFNQKIEMPQIFNINIHDNNIICIKILSNGDLITGSMDKTFKIWKIKMKNNLNNL